MEDFQINLPPIQRKRKSFEYIILPVWGGEKKKEDIRAEGSIASSCHGVSEFGRFHAAQGWSRDRNLRTSEYALTSSAARHEREGRLSCEKASVTLQIQRNTREGNLSSNYSPFRTVRITYRTLFSLLFLFLGNSDNRASGFWLRSGQLGHVSRWVAMRAKIVLRTTCRTSGIPLVTAIKDVINAFLFFFFYFSFRGHTCRWKDSKRVQDYSMSFARDSKIYAVVARQRTLRMSMLVKVEFSSLCEIPRASDFF